MRRDFSSFFQSSDLLICTVYGEIAPQLDADFCRSLNLCPSLLLRDSGSLKCRLIPNHVTDTLPINLICCKMLLQLFFFLLVPLTFPAFCYLCPNFFETCCSHLIKNELIFNSKMFQFQHMISFCIVNKISVWDLKVTAFCFYLHFKKCPNFFGIGVVSL